MTRHPKSYGAAAALAYLEFKPGFEATGAVGAATTAGLAGTAVALAGTPLLLWLRSTGRLQRDALLGKACQLLQLGIREAKRCIISIPIIMTVFVRVSEADIKTLNP
jgi:hypothetical protein